MQTFVPDERGFIESLSKLDNKRLGKQRVEAAQIIKALLDPDYGWQNHPAVNMWRNDLWPLMRYHDVCIQVWKNRGFKNNMPRFIDSLKITKIGLYKITHPYWQNPKWWGQKTVHSSHRANLIRKDPGFYGNFGWSETEMEGYTWPV